MEYSTTLIGTEPIVITIGNFDGIHKGHQGLLHEVRNLARTLDSRPVFLTFQPHTLKVVRPDISLQCLTTLEEKLALTSVYGGIQDSIVVTFTSQVASLSATAFMDDLCAHFNLRGLVVGENFSLGHNRMGDVSFLKGYGQKHDLTVHAVPLAELEDQRISSTRIRKLVGEGNVAEARELLGHTVMFNSVVVPGDQRGRLLGYPTANLVPTPEKLIPANGIYAAIVHVEKSQVQSDTDRASHVFITTSVNVDETSEEWSTYNSAVSVGVRPTFDGRTRLVEAYLLDVEGLNLYGKYINIHFIAHLRDELRFSSIEALKAQIAEDVNDTRNILQEGR